MPNVHERILIYGELLLQRALERIEAEQFRRAEVSAASAGAAAVFLEEDTGTPPAIKGRAAALSTAAERLLSEIWAHETTRYGERFLSGAERQAQESCHREAALFVSDLRSAAQETQRSS